jgi:hypothetical protein
MGVLRSLGVMKTISGYENKATHGIVETHKIIPHGTSPN